MSESTLPQPFASQDVVAKPRVVTIGTFDGVHLGHQALFGDAAARAARLGVPSMALTFEPVPAAVLRPDLFSGRVTSAAEKQRLLDQQPLDEIVTFRFDLAFSQQSPEDFMSHVLTRTGLVELWVGEAFALGKNRAGNVDRLRQIGIELGFAVTAVPRLSLDGDVVSSSGIRNALITGAVARARRLLGRPFRLSGEVIHGAHLGRTIGYPTANVAPPAELVPLADGIYVSRTRLPKDEIFLPSMTYVGTRPTVNSGERLVETHLLDFEEEIYGQVIEIEFLDRIRGDAVFEGLEALIVQLKSDEAASRQLHRAERVSSGGG